MKGKVVIERALSKLGIASRAKTREWIKQRRLAVNGDIVLDAHIYVVPETSSFTLDGKLLRQQKEKTIVLHKPSGFVTTCKDEKERKTVYDLLPFDLHHLHPVGRLDMHTTGLLLLTSNTRFSSHMTNPINQIKRVYLVSVRGKVEEEEVILLKKGIENQGELLLAQDVCIRKSSHKESHLIITLTQGKNREIRRMMEAISHEVITLKRVSFGPFSLEDLPIGQWKDVSDLIY
jgi:pseudouridine synthase